MTISQIKQQIASTSVRDVVQAALDNAKADSSHAILEIVEHRSLERADEIDRKIRIGEECGVLAGIPFIAKDNMLTYASKTTAASKLLENFEAPFQSEAIDRLEAAGAICIGKANLDAFAHGGSTENSAFGPTKNPHDDTRVAGGSSGGSAASVALNIVPFALGTDTGGSIRQPASFCGVFGMKPSYGAVSRYGVVAMASSTDVIGPITHCAKDAEIVMRVIAGQDEKDSTTIENPFNTTTEVSKKVVGLVREWMVAGVDDEVRQAIEKTVTTLKANGFEVREMSLPSLQYSLAVYYIIVPAEVASNLARYDGVRYGVRPEGASQLDQVYSSTRTQGFMPENKRRIMIGNYVLSSGYYDAYFQKAAKVRTMIVQEMDTALQDVDFLIGPTAPSTAFELGANTKDPLQMYLADQMTVAASLGGHPAVSVPLKTESLPIGFQAVGTRGSDKALLEFSQTLEDLKV